MKRRRNRSRHAQRDPRAIAVQAKLRELALAAHHRDRARAGLRELAETIATERAAGRDPMVAEERNMVELKAFVDQLEEELRTLQVSAGFETKAANKPRMVDPEIDRHLCELGLGN